MTIHEKRAHQGPPGKFKAARLAPPPQSMAEMLKRSYGPTFIPAKVRPRKRRVAFARLMGMLVKR